MSVPWHVALSAIGSDCGPMPAEAGHAVLLVSSLVLLAGALLQLALHRLWRRARTELRFHLYPTAIALGVTLAVALVSRAHAPNPWSA